MRTGPLKSVAALGWAGLSRVLSRPQALNDYLGNLNSRVLSASVGGDVGVFGVRRLGVRSETETEFDVTERHFGGNIIGSFHAENGSMNDNFREAVDALDISDLRYPAGEPDVAYADGVIINDALPDHVHNFFASIEDRGGQIVMVIPTFGSYTGPQELQQFVELVMTSYGDKVRAWEIGNEYWQMQNETEYGRIANESVEAISNGLDAAGTTSDIWVQIGNASGAASDFRDHPTLGWVDSTIGANNAIIAELSEETIARIDGLVEHVYLRDAGQIIGDEIEATNMAALDLSTWEETTGRTFDFAVTEWNIKANNLEQHGLKGGSALLQHTENLLRLGADDMHVWSPQHNTKTDLAGSSQVLFDADTGFVNNTVIGAMFDVMSSSLPGKTLLDLEITGETTGITTHAFADGEELTIYVASRSESIEEVRFDLADVFANAALESALLIGYDKSGDSSDGTHFSQVEGRFVPADFIIVEDAPYFFNEHEVNAALDWLDTAGMAAGDSFDFRLLPYEIIELTYSIEDDPLRLRTRGADRLEYDGEDSLIEALEGNDTVDAGDGQDTVFAGEGHDHVILGAGDDVGFGEDGNDFLGGWGGHDTLHGGAGDDTIYGFQDDDDIRGDAGNDTLRGDAGDDLLDGGAQNDHLQGGTGQDSLLGGDGFDFLEGNDGDDDLQGGGGGDRMDGGAGDDLLLGENGADYLSGGTGSDTLEGGAGDDRLLGGDDTDRLSGGTGDDDLFGGQGADTLLGGAGDDLLTGGVNADTFEFHDNHGHDVIDDFDVASVDERIDLRGVTTLTQFQDVMPLARQDSDDVVIETGSQSSVRLKNVQLEELEADDFAF